MSKVVSHGAAFDLQEGTLKYFAHRAGLWMDPWAKSDAEVTEKAIVNLRTCGYVLEGYYVTGYKYMWCVYKFKLV